VAHSLGRTLLGRGHAVRMLAGEKTGDDDWVCSIDEASSGSGKLRAGLHRAGLNGLHLDSSFPGSISADQLEGVDVVHLHDPAHFNLRHLPALSRRVPVVMTLHTMAPFTGNCLYSMGCERYRERCGDCPQKDEFPLHYLHRDASGAMVRMKRWLYGRSEVYPVGVSQWVADRARESAVLGRKEIHVVPNGIDLSRFPVQDTISCKRQLGIPPGTGTILLSISPDMEDRRKGIDVAVAALQLLGRENLMLLPLGITPGGDELSEMLQYLPVPSLPPRHLESEEQLALHYGAADVVWHPSRADTSSMVSMEAMSCGTPVIAARVGGVPEVVIEGESGVLIPPENAEALAEATRSIFRDRLALNRLSKSAARIARERHDVERMTTDYLEVYHGAMARHRRPE